MKLQCSSSGIMAQSSKEICIIIMSHWQIMNACRKKAEPQVNQVNLLSQHGQWLIHMSIMLPSQSMKLCGEVLEAHCAYPHRHDISSGAKHKGEKSREKSAIGVEGFGFKLLWR